MKNDAQEALRLLPKMDEVIRLLEGTDLAERFPRHLVVEACRSAVDRMRRAILESKRGSFPHPSAEGAAALARARLEKLAGRSLRRVVNANRNYSPYQPGKGAASAKRLWNKSLR